jgi:glycosyltransferase involved in cell wall biosynthesis
MIDYMYNYAISIIVPTYRPSGYIYDCLFSIKNQTVSKELFEIIIILNGEKEPYYTDINTFLEKELVAYHVQLIFSSNKGVSNARNVGIEKSKGKYLAFIDDDDIISERYLQAMYDIAEKNIMPLSYLKTFKDNIINSANDYITDNYEKNINKRLCILNTRSYFSTSCCKLIDRNIIASGRFDVKIQNGEDSLFMFSVSDKIKQLRFTGKDCIYYRRLRKNSLSLQKRSLINRMNNFSVLFLAYTIIYFKKPFKYNFLFYISRILAYFKNAKNH